jgi:hypothetical protein
MDFRTIVNALLKIFYYAYAHLIKVYVFFVPLPIQIPVLTILDFTNQYNEKNKKRFLDTFETPLPIININIEPEFYDKKEYSSFYFFDFDFRLIVFFLPYLQCCFWENPFGLLQLIDFLYFILHLPPLVLLRDVFIII